MEDENVILYRRALSNGLPDPNGQFARIGPNTTISDLSSIGMQDCVSAMYVHPRMQVTVWEHNNFTGRYAVFYGSLGTTVDFWAIRSAGLVNAISSINVMELQTFDAWKLACCRGEKSPGECGKYATQAYSVCGSMNCSGASLKSDGVCQTWCKKNPEACDTLKIQFCGHNPTDPYCGCILDTPAALAERQKYPTLIANRKCWPASDCSKTDLSGTFITAELSPNMGCPSTLINQMNQINAAQGATVIANQSQSASVSSGPKPAPSRGSSFFWIFLLILFIVIIGGSAAIYFADFERESAEQFIHD